MACSGTGPRQGGGSVSWVARRRRRTGLAGWISLQVPCVTVCGDGENERQGEESVRSSEFGVDDRHRQPALRSSSLGRSGSASISATPAHARPTPAQTRPGKAASVPASQTPNPSTRTRTGSPPCPILHVQVQGGLCAWVPTCTRRSRPGSALSAPPRFGLAGNEAPGRGAARLGRHRARAGPLAWHVRVTCGT